MSDLGPVGLCQICRHGREIRSAKGSLFWLCERSRREPKYAKYPPLPVLACLGYEHRGGHGEKKR
jgi:hypothetical protein